MVDVVLDALTRVLGRAVDARADTPLTALGFEESAWPALAAALSGSARLGDEDVRGIVTVGDLVAAVEAQAAMP